MVGKSGTYVLYHYSQGKPDITDMLRIVPLKYPPLLLYPNRYILFPYYSYYTLKGL